MDWFSNINEYTNLIDVAILLTLIVISIHLFTKSRTALIDVNKVQLAKKDAEIQSLKMQLEQAEKNHREIERFLELQLNFFRTILQLPENQKIEAIKHIYEAEIRRLEDALKHKDISYLRALKEQADDINKQSSPTLNMVMGILNRTVDITLTLLRENRHIFLQ